MRAFNRQVVYRLVASILLASLALLLFILNREEDIKTPEEMQHEFVFAARSIDEQIDGILENFGIDRAWVQRKEIPGSDKEFARVERRVLIPPTIIPVLINREFNLLAKRFQGRAVATENLKENTVTIHLIIQHSIIQTIILKTHQDIRAKGKREQRKEA